MLELWDTPKFSIRGDKETAKKTEKDVLERLEEKQEWCFRNLEKKMEKMIKYCSQVMQNED